jgi:CheY-like chemotaxis protein
MHAARMMGRVESRDRLVLVVEDDPDVRETLQVVLEDEGVRTVGVGNGREAIDFLNTGPARPDLILLDLMMPVMSGVEFLLWMRQQPDTTQVPVVLVSASNPTLAKRAVEEFNLAGFLQKPLNLEDLNAVVASVGT